MMRDGTIELPEEPQLCSAEGELFSYLRVELPVSLSQAVGRHHANLVQLADVLGRIGLPRADVQRHVLELVESYRNELLLALDDLPAD